MRNIHQLLNCAHTLRTVARRGRAGQRAAPNLTKPKAERKAHRWPPVPSAETMIPATQPNKGGHHEADRLYRHRRARRTRRHSGQRQTALRKATPLGTSTLGKITRIGFLKIGFLARKALLEHFFQKTNACYFSGVPAHAMRRAANPPFLNTGKQVGIIVEHRVFLARPLPLIPHSLV